MELLYLARTAQPSINRPLAAIQLPATRTAIRVHCGAQPDHERGNQGHQHEHRKDQSEKSHGRGAGLAHPFRSDIRGRDLAAQPARWLPATRAWHRPRAIRPATETTPQRRTDAVPVAAAAVKTERDRPRATRREERRGRDVHRWLRESGQQRQSEHGNDIFGAHQEVHQPVIDRTHAGGIEVRLGGNGAHQQSKHDERVKRHPRLAGGVSCDRLPQEEHSSHCYQGASNAEQPLSPGPAVHRADADSQCVQASSRDYESHAVKQGALARAGVRFRAHVRGRSRRSQPAQPPPRAAGGLEHHGSAQHDGRQQRSHTRCPAMARPSARAFHRTPSPWEMPPATARSPARQVARPTIRPPPSPARGPDQRWDGGSRSENRRLRLSADARRQAVRHSNRSTRSSNASCPREMLSAVRSHRAPPKSNITRCTVQNAPSEPTVYPGIASAQRGQRTSRIRKERSSARIRAMKLSCPSLDSDIEADQRQWQFVARKPALVSALAKPKPCSNRRQTRRPRDGEW